MRRFNQFVGRRGAKDLSDWSKIEIQEFDAIATSNDRLSLLAGRLVLERLPFTFETKEQYLNWKDRLARGLGVDACDVFLVGSACTGRSLSARTHFSVFNRSGSDIDIAVVSPLRFEEAWQWFRDTNPDVLGLDSDRRKTFDRHRDWNVFHGFIASEYFLSYFTFGNEWLTHLQIAEEHLPSLLKGRPASIRIYRDAGSLRRQTEESMRIFRMYKGAST